MLARGVRRAATAMVSMTKSKTHEGATAAPLAARLSCLASPPVLGCTTEVGSEHSEATTTVSQPLLSSSQQHQADHSSSNQG